MFVGRENELEQLASAYKSKKFEMVVVYGRRRVGKTTLLTHFAQNKRALYYTAQQQSDHDNLADFSREIARHFSLPADLVFGSWESAFGFLSERAGEEDLLFIFDEFPYAAEANKSLASILQIAIDHGFTRTNACIVLCGSDQGFMESEVLGAKSPLHGRRTMQLRVRPFDYLTTARMLEHVSDEDAFKYYACVGGIPYYLAQIDQKLGFDENISRLFFSSSGFLYEEPMLLLRQELRSPSLYNSILRAMGSGANKQNEISDRSGIETTAVNKYLKTLVRLDIVERVVPFGENPETSKKSLYRFSDGCYDFWYTFVMPVVGDIEEGLGSVAVQAAFGQRLDTYLGKRFERVCLEWMRRQSLKGALPIAASGFGSWWGANPLTHAQDDIDVVAADRSSKEAIIGECKYRNSFDERMALERLHDRIACIKGYSVVGTWLFSKHVLSKKTISSMNAEPGLRSVTLSDLFAER